ncbi:hypothetical protein CBR_g50617 [Chara braunii]|uniref:Uncharacterized protein n=1 Tax=Chara braunii TaxID=69332 RepID=A0A388M7B0_CHABU|nr:hypothetical protein CBR_g50617 [Chara braunii]|eukprot:GBG90369.1 hypothetical protein CBR_g50617 [Chara braunii]
MYTWVCASPAERNWALQERIHEKRRNRLDFTKLTEMVEMCANKKLLACRQRRRGLVMPWGDLEEGLDDVPEPCRSAHIELYNKDIEYDPPTDPHAADEMEAEPSATDRGRKQTQVVRSSSEDEGGDRSDDGDAADDEDSDVEREGPDHDRGHGDEHGFNGGDGSGPIEDRAGGAFLVTPGPGVVGGGGSGGHGFGLEVPQGSIPSGIFSDGFDLGRPPTSDARPDGRLPERQARYRRAGLVTTSVVLPGGYIWTPRTCLRRSVWHRAFGTERLAQMVSGCATTQRLALEQDTTRAREMGCSVEEVTAARLAAECRHDGPVDVADGGLCTEGHVVDRADDHQEDARVGLRGLCGASDTVLPSTDEADVGDGATTTDTGGLLGCDRTEVEGQVDRALVGIAVAAMEDVVADHTQDSLVAVDAMVAHRSEVERQVDPVDVVAHPVEAHVPSMSPLERHTAKIDPVMGRSRHISKRPWKVVPPSSFVPVIPPAPSGVSGDIGKTMEMADLFEQLTGQRVVEPGGVSWGAGPVAAGTRLACGGAVSGRGGESGGNVVGGGGGPGVVGGRSGLSGGRVGWGEGSAAPATAGGCGQVQGSPSSSSKVKGKSVSWSGISRVTRKLKDAMLGVTDERRDHRRGSTMIAPPSRPPTAGAAQGDGHRRPKGRSSTHASPSARPPPASLEDDPDPVTLQTSRGGCISTAYRILDEEPLHQTGEGEETAAKVPQRRRERMIDDDDTDGGQCDAP